MIETDSPTNPGDSGGPLVNDKGELVGVTQGAALDAQSLSIFVDLSEVKRLLRRRGVQALRSDTATTAAQPKEPLKPPREKPLESKDEGKFFSEEEWKKVAPAAEKLLKEKGIDFLIETYMTPPKADAAKLKAMKPQERTKFFKELAAAGEGVEAQRGLHSREPQTGDALCARRGAGGEDLPHRFRADDPVRSRLELHRKEVRLRPTAGTGTHVEGKGTGGEEVTAAAAPDGLMLCDDLIFFSRVSGTARAAGLSVRMVRSAAELIAAAHVRLRQAASLWTSTIPAWIWMHCWRN